MSTLDFCLLNLKVHSICPVCGFRFSRKGYGKTNHYRKHARDGEVVELPDPDGWYGNPYGYFLPDDVDKVKSKPVEVKRG